MEHTMRWQTVRAGLRGLAALAAAGLCLTLSGESLEAKASAVGSVNYVTGSATRTGGSGKEADLSKGAHLFQGDKLTTGKGARLEAKLQDGSMVRLGEKSELELKNLTMGTKKKARKFKLKLVVGRVWSAVRNVFGSEPSFEVETTTAVAGVRGTRFQAAATSSGETLVKVYGGQVLVSNKPVYAIEGHSKDTRVEVAGPQEVSKKQWEELIAGAMQQVRVASDGKMSAAESFELAQGDDDWEAWNNERDNEQGMAGE
jgi:ferric-dicitrate binding protein FerR (iron transport regulator)